MGDDRCAPEQAQLRGRYLRRLVHLSPNVVKPTGVRAISAHVTALLGGRRYIAHDTPV
jgi:hypothetical protein